MANLKVCSLFIGISTRNPCNKTPRKKEHQLFTKESKKLPSTLEAIKLSLVASRGRPLTLLWNSRKSPYVDLTDGKTYFDPLTVFGTLAPKTREGVSCVPWPEAVEHLRKRIGVQITERRVSYLSAVKGARRAPKPTVDIFDRLSSEAPTIIPPERWGFEVMGGGTSRLPFWLSYVSPKRRLMNAGLVGCTLSELVGGRIDHLYSRVVQMRGHSDDKTPFRLHVWRNADPWPRDTRGALLPEQAVKALNLAPEIWIRRRIARRSSVLSLSIYGTREVGRGRWEVVDITALAALHCTETTPKCAAWRRAVYLVERGDGLEWIILHPAHDLQEFVAGSNQSCGLRGDEYEGSPARRVLSKLREIFPAAPRVRWILDDSPLRDAGEVQ